LDRLETRRTLVLAALAVLVSGRKRDLINRDLSIHSVVTRHISGLDALRAQ